MQGSSLDVVHACSVAGGPGVPDTHYLRAGHGAPVLLLAGDPDVTNVLVGGLPRTFRSIAPTLSAPGEARTPDFATWLRRFLDALGLSRVSIVVDQVFAADVLGYSLQEPERVDRLAFLLGPAGTQPGDVGRGVVDRFVTAGQVLLATPFDAREGAARDRSLAELGKFLHSREIAP